MSIFDRIKHAIFGEAHASQSSGRASLPTEQSPSSPKPAQSAPSPSASAPASSAAPTGTATPGSTSPSTGQMVSSARQQSATVESSTTASSQPIDIEPILNEAVNKSGQKLDWRHSIVDLMKALGMDASLEERKELAQELGYSGDVHDSAKMNMFLHRALMKKLSENGGKVPANLLD
ncbi:DUF3597 domain-containing protein [Rhizobium sp. S163]|uniref:DUF3597 domain-containing protein n=1 Tax=Rhizobium sp. S163 TaxID=3055039 RepID=UPI0025A9E31C|nr:DUF3597 domain-containing protein [Rhizobium sp. S163]MDM9649115.1 DUF3597 domain-containing protein [Rhizobium sp. S163]